MFQGTWYFMGQSIVHAYVRHVLQADIVKEGDFPPGAKIIAVNHPSTSDPAYITALFQEQVSILIREALFKVPVFGRSLRMSGHVPVLPGNGRAALEEGVRLLNSGRTVVIFPEGEISPQGGFHKGHTGVARLALRTGAPVIPVGISLDHTHIRLVQTKVEGILEPSAWYLHGPYAMTVGRPEKFTGSPDDHECVREITGQVMQRIIRLSKNGDQRLIAAERQAAERAANAGAFSRAAHWAGHSVALRVIQAALFSLITFAGKA